MLFFKLKTNQKLILAVLFGATLLASCSTSRKVAVSQKRSAAGKERISKNETAAKKEISEKEMIAEKETISKTEKPADDKTEKVISTARTFIGTPYKYGGTTRSGMDCSALLIKSFGAVKVNLPRSSEAQSKVGTPIKMSELKPGDLVFFATGNKKKEITHVGLVTDVKAKDNVKFIHASSSLGVVETNLFADYYQKRFRVARRVID